MAYKYSFLDGETYGAEDINSISQRITGSGVSPFLTKDIYNPADLNSLTRELVEAGTSTDGLKLTKENGKVKINKGIGFFSSGATIEVDDEGVELDIVSGETNYIFAEHNEETNIISFKNSSERPEETTYIHPILLGKISMSGVLSDLRTYARSKILTTGRNNVKIISLSDITRGDDKTIYTPDFDYSEYNYVFAIIQDAFSSSLSYPVRVYDLNAGKTLNKDSNNAHAYFEVRDKKIALCAEGTQTFKKIDIYFV